MRIGLFTDAHAGVIPAKMSNFYSHTFVKYQDYCAYFHRENVDFVVELGDICEWDDDAEKVNEAFTRISRTFAMSRYPMIYVLGNHDVANRTKMEFYEALKSSVPARYFGNRPRPEPIPVQPENSPYFSFVKEGWKFIVLDTINDAEGRSIENRLERNYTYTVSPEELEWLKNELSDGMRAIVFTHVNIDAQPVNGQTPGYVLYNAEEVRKVLESGNVKLVMQGHAHVGSFVETNGIPYVTMPATLIGEYPDHMSVAVLDVQDDSLHIEGFVDMPSYDFKV